MSDAPLDNCSVLVLRPKGLQQQLCTSIEIAGGRAIPLPMLQINNLPINHSILGRQHGIVFVSRNAVRAVARHSALFANAGLYAVGNGTATELLGLGCSGIVSAGMKGGSESLLAHPDLQQDQVKGKNWLIVCGTISRELLPETLEERGAKVQHAIVYESEPMQYQPQQMANLHIPDIIVAYSVAEIQQLAHLVPEEMRARLLQTALAVLSERIAEKARETGFCGQIAVAPDTSDAGCLQAILRLRQNQP